MIWLIFIYTMINNNIYLYTINIVEYENNIILQYFITINMYLYNIYIYIYLFMNHIWVKTIYQGVLYYLYSILCSNQMFSWPMATKFFFHCGSARIWNIQDAQGPGATCKCDIVAQIKYIYICIYIYIHIYK